jgi:hypothetical protein
VAIWITKSWLVKGTVSRDILLPVFSCIIFLQDHENNIRIKRFIKFAYRPQVKVHHRYQRHRQQICQWCQRQWWQIMGTISDYSHLKVNLKEKIYSYVNSTNQRYPNKTIKTFLIKEFSICHRCQRHLWCTLSCEYLRVFENLQIILNNGILRGLGETDS